MRYYIELAGSIAELSAREPIPGKPFITVATGR
jgi:hypothetical protein